MNYSASSLRRNALVVLAITAAIPAITHADTMSKEKGISMGASAAIGAIAGGPVGFAAGAIFGGILGDNADQRVQISNQEVDMNQAAQEIDQLENQITKMDLAMVDIETDVAQLEQALLTRLEFQVLFRTGDDRLREEDRERIAMLAKYMQRNPEVSVRLEGHTDARGTEEYNAVLAEYRARAVADALIVRGVSQDRLEVASLGSSKAKAQPGDYEGYALDRHVNIEVVSNAQLSQQNDSAEKHDLAMAQ